MNTKTEVQGNKAIMLFGNITMFMLTLLYLVGIIIGMSIISSNKVLPNIFICLITISLFVLALNLLSIHYCIFFQIPRDCAQNKCGTFIDKDLYFSLREHIFLLLFSYNLWKYIWIYRTTKRLNIIPSVNNRTPVLELVLCIFIPFYYIYWMFKCAQRVDILNRTKEKNSNITFLCLILAIFIPVIADIILQNEMNTCSKL